MPDGWEWDPTLFRGSAVHYRRGRLPYAPGLAETAATVLGLDGRGRLLDVGCGPGTVLLALARYFTEAVGLDPDEDMLAEAERQAERRGVGNARWVTGRAEDLPAGLGTFRIVLFAQSFHWTDRDRVAATVRGMLEPGGAFVHISDVDIGDVHISDAHISDAKDAPTATASLPWPASPYAEMGELVREYLGPVRRAGQGRLVDGTPGREDLVLERAGFEDFEQHVVGRPGSSSSAPRTTWWRGRSPGPTPPLICTAADWRSSSGTCAHCCERPRRTAASRNASRRPRS
ncbi:SAM-dependent methyltransferase [Streptomyces pseudovenezuelae]